MPEISLNNMYKNCSFAKHNLPVPYKGAVNAKLTVGRIFEIKGECNGVKRFHVNLKCNEETTVLHVNPRLDDNVLVLNSYDKGEWQNEEIVNKLSIQNGKQFVITILVDEADYKIAINGQHQTCFKHRMAFSKVNRIEIAGNGVSIIELEERDDPLLYLQNASFGDVTDSSERDSVEEAEKSVEIYNNPKVPFVKELENLKPGLRISISARPTRTAHRFVINLCDKAQDGNILFHLNPRFDQRYVALNSKQNGSWTTEEGIQDFQFLHGIHFDLQLLITEQEVTVSFNRKHFTDFKHRLANIQAFKYLQIEGDIVIASIKFHKGN